MTDVVSIQLARCILKAAKIHEESYDTAAAERTKHTVQVQLIDFAQFYKKPIRIATQEACAEIGYPDLTSLVNMMLMTAWNDTIEWATRIEDKVKKLLVEDEIHETIVIKRIVLELDKS